MSIEQRMCQSDTDSIRYDKTHNGLNRTQAETDTLQSQSNTSNPTINSENLNQSIICHCDSVTVSYIDKQCASWQLIIL